MASFEGVSPSIHAFGRARNLTIGTNNFFIVTGSGSITLTNFPPEEPIQGPRTPPRRQTSPPETVPTEQYPRWAQDTVGSLLHGNAGLSPTAGSRGSVEVSFPDLTDRVKLLTRQVSGQYNDVYLGLMKSDNQEQIALRQRKNLVDSIDAFFNELALWGTFIHPNVLPLRGFVYNEEDTGLFAVSPWMANGTAIDFVRKHQHPNIPKMLSEIADGLAYLHSKQILHGDIRGANVLISGDYVARLSDFGLSRRMNCDEALSHPPMNFRWSPPELLTNERPFRTRQSDIWSLGMTFLELLTGEQPFREMDQDIKVWCAHKAGTLPKRPTDPPVVEAGLSDEIWSLLNRCWTEPSLRPSIKEVQQTLTNTSFYNTPTHVDKRLPRPEHTNVRDSPQANNVSEHLKATGGHLGVSKPTRVLPQYNQSTAEGRIETSPRHQAPVRSKTEGDVIQPRRLPLHLNIPQPFIDERHQLANRSAQLQTTHPTPSEPNGGGWFRQSPENTLSAAQTHWHPHRHPTQDSFAIGSASPSKVAAIRHRSTMPQMHDLNRILTSRDLTGQVTALTEEPDIVGFYNEIYMGVWQTNGQIAIRVPRALSRSDDFRDRFEREASLWGPFDHPNLLPLWGIIDFQSRLCAVSPWMANGTAIEFVNRHSNVDFFQMLSEITEGAMVLTKRLSINPTGLAYLHSKEIIHGDLRGVNVLISANCVAKLSDFRLSRSAKDDNGLLPSPHLKPRWFPPEMSVCERIPPLSKQSDIWSLGMTFLELLTGKPPFSEMSEDQQVIYAHTKGVLPKRPANPTPIGADMSNEMWMLLHRLWKKAKSRPKIEEVREGLASIRKGPKAQKPKIPTFGLKRFRSKSSRPNTPNSATSRKSSSTIKTGTTAETPETGSTGYSFDQGLTQSPVEEPLYLELPRPPRLPLDLLELDGFDASASEENGHSLQWNDGKFSPRVALSQKGRAVYLNGSGTVVAGTLVGLVDRLVYNFNLRKEQEFREVIITASIDFNTPKGFFKMLRECFEEAEEDRRRNPENMAATQINVFEVMSYWITHAQLPVNSDLLWEMQEFCEAVTERTSAPTMLKRAEELACLIRIRGAAPRMTSVPRGAQTSMTSQDVTPQGLALALTLLEGDKFRLISPSDYLAHLCGRSERTNVDAAMSVNGKIKLWVQQNIVHFDALDPRVSVMTFYINTAKELRNLRNYQSLMAIAQALDSPPIRRLALTRRSLKKDAPTHLEELMKLCDVSDQTFYRKVLSEVPDSPYRNYCIPCVAMHLEELRAVLHANERTIERDGQTLINVQRYTRFMHQVQQLFHLPPPDLERFRHQGELAYLESKLADVQIGDVADDEVLAKAISLEGIENSLDSKRAPQFRDLGFSVGKQTREDLTGH